MPDLPDELILANAILREYVAIHDTIFKFSWRKTLPIPGLFKATDFGAHFRDLDRLAAKLAATSSALKTKSGSLESSHQYTAALLETIQALREICRRFHEKSQGDLSKYPMAEYNANLKAYEGLMNKCQELGVALNQHIRGDSTQPEG
jgi:ATP phosphoribosyltransferase regulatory subunit HisZ